MTEGSSTRQLRVLHIVSAGGIAEALQPALFMPLLTRMPRPRVKAEVISLSPGCVRSDVLRQHGVPVHDLAFSRRRFSVTAIQDVLRVVRNSRPDVIQAWGHTAQILAPSLRKRCAWQPHVVLSVGDTTPLAKDAGLIDRQKLKLAAKSAASAQRIVYTSEAAAAHHRRAGFPDGGHLCISPGVDAARFKPDLAARTKVRERLQIPPRAFVVGMVAPFQPEFDHATFLKAAAELIKTTPDLYLLLAGHGVQRGNAQLMAMIGSGSLSTRVQLLGEWSDLASLFNACDVVCSSALHDSARMTLAMAMLCGIPCVATGMGAQGELLGQHSVAIEPGSPAAFIRGITKILQLTPERRAQLASGARKHALQNYVSVRSLQKYLQLYGELVGREAMADDIAVPAVDAIEPVPVPVVEAAQPAPRRTIEELADPDSLETKVDSAQAEALPKWRVEQERVRAEQETRTAKVAESTDGDVLQIFEMEIAKPSASSSIAMGERARGVADEVEDLLPVEAITVPVAPVQPEPRAEAKPAEPEQQPLFELELEPAPAPKQKAAS